jgi:hypothetical protein
MPPDKDFHCNYTAIQAHDKPPTKGILEIKLVKKSGVNQQFVPLQAQLLVNQIRCNQT